MLEKDIISQVSGVFSNLKSNFTFSLTFNKDKAKAAELREFLSDFASCSPLLSVEETSVDDDKLEFAIIRNGENTGIVFRGIPGGHEFTSLLLAVLNAEGIGKNLPDEAITARIKAISGSINLRTYMSLSCTNCPDVVQALNVITLLNPAVTHEVIDGELWQNEVNDLGIQGVPTVFADGEQLHVGRGDQIGRAHV